MFLFGGQLFQSIGQSKVYPSVSSSSPLCGSDAASCDSTSKGDVGMEVVEEEVKASTYRGDGALVILIDDDAILRCLLGDVGTRGGLFALGARCLKSSI